MAWDRFIAEVAGGAYQQSSRWAGVKAVVGWRAERVVVERDGAIVGGCQLLLRRLPILGAVAYAPRGPVIAGRRQRR